MHLYSNFGNPILNRWWLSRGQAQNGVNFDFFQLPHITIGILTKVFYTSDTNFVILAWRAGKLVINEQTDIHMHTHTDTGDNNTQRPKLIWGKKKDTIYLFVLQDFWRYHILCASSNFLYIYPTLDSSAKSALFTKFNSTHPYTLSLPCPSESKFSQLSYRPRCSHELWCTKYVTRLWSKYALVFKLYLITQDSSQALNTYECLQSILCRYV